MAKTIDERVVQMTFDNKDFEKNANQTIGTLDKLKSSLKFEESAKGLDNIQKAANKLSFASIGDAIFTIKNQFSNFETFVTGIFLRLGSRISDYLVNSIKGFTLDPILQSWSKFEQNLISEQTIMSSVSDKINKTTGELYNMSDVNAIVDQLRWYTDETSYNIDQMTNAIGSFTASGVDLELSKQAIIGISNACADAGVNVTKAESAFTGFSRAIGSGAMTLGTWNMQLKTSGITNSERFRKTLIDTATDMGYLIKVTDKLWKTTSKGGGESGLEVTVGNITESFNKGKWATSDVIINTLSKYSDTVDTLYKMTSSGKIDLTVNGLANLRKEMEKQGKTASSLKLNVQYDTASEAIEALTNAYKTLGLEVPQSLKAFERAQEAVTFSQAVSSIKEAVTSKWSKTFELIFGDYEEGKALWTKIANEGWDWFASAGDKRNALLEQWHNGISDYIMSDGLAEDAKRSKEVIDKFNKDLEESYKNSYLNIANGANSKLYNINFLKTLRFGEFEDIGKFITKNSENFKNIDFFSESELDNITKLYEEYQAVVESTDEELDKEKKILEIQKKISDEVIRTKKYEDMFNDASITKMLDKENKSNNYESYIIGLSDVFSSGDSNKIYEYINKNYKALNEYNLLTEDMVESYNEAKKASEKRYNSELERTKVLSGLKDDLKEIALLESNYGDINKLNENLDVMEEFYEAVDNKDLETAQKIILENFDLIGDSIGGYPDNIKKLYSQLNNLANSGPINKIKYDLEKIRDTTFSSKDKQAAEKYLKVVNSIEDAIKSGSDEDLTKIFKDKNATEYIKKIADAGGKIEDVKEIYSEIDRINKTTTYSTISRNKLLDLQYRKLKDIFYEMSNSDEAGDIASNFGESLNEYLFGGLSGFKLLGEALSGILDIITKIVGVFRETYEEVIGPISGLDLINMTQDFRDYVKNFEIGEKGLSKFKELLKGLLKVWKTVTDVASQFYEKTLSPIFEAIKGPFLDAIFNLMEAFGKWIGFTSDEIGKSDLFSKIFEKSGETAVKIIGYITDIINWLTNLFTITDGEESNGFLNFFRILENVFNTISTVADFLGKILEKAFEKIKEYVGKIIDVLKSPMSGNGFSPLAIGAILFGAQKVFDFDWNIISPLNTAFDAIKSIFKLISDTIDEIQGTLEASAMKNYAEAFKEIAGTLLMMSVSLLIIASIDEDKLLQALEVVGLFGIICFAFMDLSKRMSSISGGKGKGIINSLLTKIGVNPYVAREVLSIATILTSLGIALIAFAASLKIISTIPQEAIGSTILIFAVAMAAIVGAIALLAKISKNVDPSKMNAVNKMIKSLAKVLLILSVSLKLLSTIDPDYIGSSLLGLVAPLFVMTLCLESLIKATSSKEIKAKNIKAIGNAFKALSSGMLIISASLKLLSTITDPAQLILDTVIFVLLLEIMTYALEDLMKVSTNKDLKDKNIKIIGKVFKQLANSMLIISVALKLLSGMDPINLVLSTAALGILFAIITSSVKKLIDTIAIDSFVLKDKNIKAVTNMFKTLSYCMILMAASLKIISSISDPTNLLMSVLAFMSIFGIVSIVTESLIKLTDNPFIDQKKIKAVGSLFNALAFGMLIMSAALKLLSTINSEELFSYILAFLVILTSAFIAVKKITEVFSNQTPSQMLSLSALLVIVSVTMLAMVAALKLLSTVNIGSLVMSLVAFAVALEAVKRFLESASKFDIKQLGSIFLVATAMALLIPALIKLEAVMTALSVVSVGGLIKSLFAIGATLALIVTFSKSLGGSIKSIIGLAALVLAIKLLVPSLQVLSEVMASIGNLPIGTILKGILAITAFLGALTLFGILLGNSGAGMIGVAALAGSVLLLAAAIVVFSYAIEGIVKSFMAFASLGSDINPALKSFIKLIGVMTLLGVVLAVLSAPLLVASAALLILGIGINVLAAGLNTLLSAIMIFNSMGEGFSNSLSKLVNDVILTILGAIPMLITGLSILIVQLSSVIANGLTTILKTIFDFISNNAGNLVDMIAEVVTRIVEAIASKAERFGNAVMTIITVVLTIIRDNIPKIMTLVGEIIAKVLLGIGDLIPAIVNSVFQMVIKIFNGLADAIDQNGEQLGEALGRIVGSIIALIPRLLKGTAGGIGGEVSSLFTGEDYEYAFKEAGKKPAEAYVGGYTEAFNEHKDLMKQSAIDALPKKEELSGESEETGKEEANSLIDSFTGTLLNSENLTSITGGADGIIGTLSGGISSDASIESLFGSGEGTTNNFLSGMLSDTSITNLFNGGEATVDNVVSGVESDDSNKKANNSGTFIVDGIISGIKGFGNSDKLLSVGSWIFDKINEGVMDEGEIASPSKVMARNGKFTVLGFIKGIESNLPKLKQSGEIMMDAINSSIDLAEDNLNSNLSPVITPVLDLSEIQNGANGINNLLATDPLNYSRNLAMENSGMNSGVLSTGNIFNVNVDFQIDNSGKDITEADINSWSSRLVNKIDEELGFRFK